MEVTHRGSSRHQGNGFVLVSVMALVVVLLATGAAFMRWSTDESLQSAESAAAMQAYYLGQMGIIEKGFQWLRTQPAGNLPVGETILPGKSVPGYGSYSNITIRYLPSYTSGDFWAVDRRFRISSVGTVRVPVYHQGRDDYKDVKRMAVLYVAVRNFVDYMYLTDCELTSFGDRIKFMSGDTLKGRVHSNDQIAIMGSPVFYDQVSTTADDFWRWTGYAPIFLGPDPIFNAPAIEIPSMAERLRNGAAAQGNFFDFANETARAIFNRRTVIIYHWPTGTPFDSTLAQYVTVSITDGACIFVNGPLELKGKVEGKVTIGSAGTLRILDNIKYYDSDPVTGFYSDVGLEDRTNLLGIVSEAEVKIANTPENGRENSAGLGRSQRNQNLTNIIINGAIVALGESFTFENQNDPDSGYVYDGGRDDRGTIYLFGSVTQMRRGYVHRGNLGSTGYLKQYRYDSRFSQKRPPCFFEVENSRGFALFNVIQWGQAVEYGPAVRDGNIVRYN